MALGILAFPLFRFVFACVTRASSRASDLFNTTGSNSLARRTGIRLGAASEGFGSTGNLVRVLRRQESDTALGSFSISPIPTIPGGGFVCGVPGRFASSCGLVRDLARDLMRDGELLSKRPRTFRCEYLVEAPMGVSIVASVYWIAFLAWARLRKSLSILVLSLYRALDLVFQFLPLPCSRVELSFSEISPSRSSVGRLLEVGGESATSRGSRKNIPVIKACPGPVLLPSITSELFCLSTFLEHVIEIGIADKTRTHPLESPVYATI